MEYIPVDGILVLILLGAFAYSSSWLVKHSLDSLGRSRGRTAKTLSVRRLYGDRRAIRHFTGVPYDPSKRRR